MAVFTEIDWEATVKSEKDNPSNQPISEARFLEVADKLSGASLARLEELQVVVPTMESVARHYMYQYSLVESVTNFSDGLHIRDVQTGYSAKMDIPWRNRRTLFTAFCADYDLPQGDVVPPSINLAYHVHPALLDGLWPYWEKYGGNHYALQQGSLRIRTLELVPGESTEQLRQRVVTAYAQLLATIEKDEMLPMQVLEKAREQVI